MSGTGKFFSLNLHQAIKLKTVGEIIVHVQIILPVSCTALSQAEHTVKGLPSEEKETPHSLHSQQLDYLPAIIAKQTHMEVKAKGKKKSQ